MEIKTKFNVGDEVFAITHEHRLVKFVVGRIDVAIKKDEVGVFCCPSDGNGGYEYMPFDEKYCFATEDEAMSYVKGR